MNDEIYIFLTPNMMLVFIARNCIYCTLGNAIYNPLLVRDRVFIVINEEIYIYLLLFWCAREDLLILLCIYYILENVQ